MASKRKPSRKAKPSSSLPDKTVHDANPAPPCIGRNDLEEAVLAEAKSLGMSPREARRHVEALADRLRVDTAPNERSDVRCYDLRAEQDYTYPGDKRKTRLVAGDPVRRAITDVDTLVLHQTAIEFGVSKRAIAAASGDRELALARRALDVAAHAMAFRDGFYVLAHDVRDYVNHANRLNLRSVGLEIDGLYPGLADDPTTAAREDLLTTWKGQPTALTDITVEASCQAAKRLCDEVEAAGGRIRFLRAHRQSSDARRSDPGEEIWRRVGLDYCVSVLGLKALRDSRWNQGRPIPADWDPEGIGAY